MASQVGISTTKPEPADSDFAIYIDFDRNAPKPQRIFQSIEGLISAFERLDRALAGSIDSSIEPVLMLEDIEAGSIKVWLRDVLLQTEDHNLQELDWRRIVGRYLVVAKYAFVRWVNDEEERSRPGSLADLREHFALLARETDVKKIPAYGVPSATEILSTAEDVARALGRLSSSDKAQFLTRDGEQNFNLLIDWNQLNIAELAVRETILSPAIPMILAVRKPDYLGETQWEFRHGKKTIRAKIIDENWLRKFQARRIDVRPGDALRCRVSQEIKYGYDNELISETYTIERVEEVLENRFRQTDLFDDDESP